MPGNLKEKFKITTLFIFSLLALFYLFILPVIIASNINKIPFFGALLSIIFGAFLIFQLWLLIFIYFIITIFVVFNIEYKLFKKTTLCKNIFLIIRKIAGKENERILKSKIHILFITILNYIFIIYGFGVIYIFISNINKTAFNCGSLSIIKGMYFSFITTSTVGYGDIIPRCDLVRIIVVIEIAISMIHLLIVLTSVVNYLRDDTK